MHKKIIWDKTKSVSKHNGISNEIVYLVSSDHMGEYIINETGIRLYNLDGFLNIDEYLFKNYGYTTSDILTNKYGDDGNKYIYTNITYSPTIQIYIKSIDGNIVGMANPENFISVERERLRIINEILK